MSEIQFKSFKGGLQYKTDKGTFQVKICTLEFNV